MSGRRLYVYGVKACSRGALEKEFGRYGEVTDVYKPSG